MRITSLSNKGSPTVQLREKFFLPGTSSNNPLDLAVQFFFSKTVYEIIDLAWKAKKAGVFYLGGGEPKNFIQQAMQFSKAALFGVQITTEPESYGGSSGARLREGISWGKLDEKAKFVDVYCDATIALPLILGSVKDYNNL